MKTIYLVRHGQTLFNQQHKIQGFCDSPLTKVGIQQAKIAKKHLDETGIQFDEAYCSTSERAVDTLELLTDLPYQTVKNLREWNFGSYEGEGEHMNPPLPYNDFFVQFGGESQVELEERISSTIHELVKGSTGENILIVSHGAAIANFYNHWQQENVVNRKSRIQNCSFLKYVYDNDTFKLVDIIEHDYSELS